jgi:signal transduction histidine kinase
MSPADIRWQCKPFTQLDNRLARRYEGTGLGLPLTRSLVELHGGSLRLESALSEGTTVTVAFPASRSDRQRPSCAAANSRQIVAASPDVNLGN